MICVTNVLRHACVRGGVVVPSSHLIADRCWLTTSSSPPEVTAIPAQPEEKSFVKRWLGKEAIVAGPNYNRWMCVPPVVAVQMSIGSIYTWSLFNGPLTRELGVVASSSADWGFSEVVPIFSTTAAFMGMTVFFGGSWVDRVGPRQAGVCAATLWSSGLALAGVGTMLHQLPLLYLGYGVLGGIGFGLGVTSPVANLVKWFPDRKGLASGMALSGFGAGAMVATPIIETGLSKFHRAPEALGSVMDLHVITEGGKRMVEVQGQLQEVVISSDVAYLVGTGATGVAETFVTLSAIYAAAMMSGAFLQRAPPPGYAEGFVDTTLKDDGDWYVPTDQIFRTHQFPMMWLGAYGYGIAGVSILSCAKTMVHEVYGGALPLVVTGTFAASFVASLSLMNMLGRLGWSSGSDYIGRKATFVAFGAVGVPSCLVLPQLADWVSNSPEPTVVPLYLFCGTTALMMTTYGGLLAVLPAYAADLYGVRQTTNVYGKALSGWACAATTGPILLTRLRESAYNNACAELTSVCDPDAFCAKFGAPVDQLHLLLESKAVTIASLMELAPVGTINPTPMLYDTTMYTMGGICFGALALNAAITPIDRKYKVFEVSEGTAEK